MYLCPPNAVTAASEQGRLQWTRSRSSVPDLYNKMGDLKCWIALIDRVRTLNAFQIPVDMPFVNSCDMKAGIEVRKQSANCWIATKAVRDLQPFWSSVA